jgi:hypothetical protein
MQKTYTITAPEAFDGAERASRVKPMSEMYGIMALCVLIGLFFVNFIWGFTERDFFALGANMTVLLSLSYFLFAKVFAGKELFAKANLAWLIPFGLMALSFSLYDNQFLKFFTCLVLIPAFLVFYNYAQLEHRERRPWDAAFFGGLIRRFFALLPKVSRAVGLYGDVVFPRERQGLAVVKKVLIGVLLLALLALLVVIPLLSAADPLFAAKMQEIYRSFDGLFSPEFVAKVVVFSILSVLLLAISLAWLWPFELSERRKADKEVDPIITGIVLGGILVLYLFFLYLQLNRLWVHALPVSFQETEGLVKSGFWQLFFLSVINILLFSASFRKTNAFVHRILAVFVGASFLLLLSAGYRMFLYATTYGFSYEKFFASYTVLYIGVLFVWIVTRFFRAERPNIMKFSAFLFLWMFAVTTVLPVEQFILQTNLQLIKRPDSRIRLYEMTMLSPDVLGSVQKYAARDAEKCKEKDTRKETGSLEFCGWDDWLQKRRAEVDKKKWYETNLTNWIYLSRN